MSQESVDTLIQKGQALLYLKRYKEATKVLSQAISIEQNNVTGLYALIYALIKDGDSVSAKHIINLLLQHAPDDSETYFIAAYFYITCNNYKKAKTFIQQAITLNPRDSSYFGLLASIYQQFQQWSFAYQMAQAGLQINPNDNGCLEIKLMSCANLGHYGEMMQLINLILNIKPNNASTHSVVGWARLLNEDPDEAQKHFYESLRIDPTNQSSKRGLIQLIKRKNRFYLLLQSIKNKTNSITGSNIFTWAWTFSLSYFAFVWASYPISELGYVAKIAFYIFIGTILFFMLLKVSIIYLNTYLIEPITDIILLSNKEQNEILTNTEKKQSYRLLLILLFTLIILSTLLYANL